MPPPPPGTRVADRGGNPGRRRGEESKDLRGITPDSPMGCGGVKSRKVEANAENRSQNLKTERKQDETWKQKLKNGGKVEAKRMKTGDLKILIENGVKPRRGIPGIVLPHFSEITEARGLGWSWTDIAEALGREGEHKAIATAWGKIKKRIASGKLKIPGKHNIRKELTPEKKGFPESNKPTPAGGVVTGTKTPDPKELEPSGASWPEIKY